MLDSVVEFDREYGPFVAQVEDRFTPDEGEFQRQIRATPETRIVFFPEEFRSGTNAGNGVE
jgi:hypothetical protein